LSPFTTVEKAKADPTQAAEALVFMSQIAINKGDPQKAIRLLNERTNRIAPTVVTEHLLGRAYLEAGDYTAKRDSS